jgi:hypothetical protein
MIAGILAGGALLTLVLVVVRSIVDAAIRPIPATVALGFTVLAAVGDLWAIRTDRLYPFAVRRQARKSIMYRWKTAWRIAFTWGFDAGLSLGTYRVTSGLWVGAFAVVVGLATPLLALIYAAAFAAALVAIVLWPTRGSNPDMRAEAALDRIMGLAPRRRIVQSLYMLGLSLLVVSILVGSVDL